MNGTGVGGNRTPTGGTGGANLLAVRSHNTALVLDLLRAAGTDGISRLELAERTGLTPQAVSKITARLREEGLAAEAGHRASTGGKPRTVLRLVPDAGHAVGVHLDRDELRTVLADLTGTVVTERRTPIDLGVGADGVIEAVVGEVGAVAAGVGPGGAGAGARGAAGSGVRSVTGVGSGTAGAGEASPGGTSDPDYPRGTPDPGHPIGTPALLGVGIALPGPLDHLRGVLHRVTGFPEWDGFPLRDALMRRLGVPVVVDKDTNAAALGLALGGGVAPDGSSFAYLHLGTGLGAGLVLGGALHRGARTGAGEFGHQVVQLDGPPCGCGNRGCVEALCLAAVARGDLAEAARVLGTGAGNLVALLDVDLVLLGGRTVTDAPGPFVRGVAAILDTRAHRTGEPPIPVRAAPAGVAEGAAQLVLAPLFGRAPLTCAP
ncbi:ROK family protein [Streptomyces sp. NPDC087425]|uniref:ROK family transcriptional regulator n=1 Tax=unclassified Streptomyces TaxID=2593676 RepID=UPI0038306791